MGNEESRTVDNGNGEFDPTKNYDKRTSRKHHKDSFTKAIESWTSEKRKKARQARKAKLMSTLEALEINDDTPNLSAKPNFRPRPTRNSTRKQKIEPRRRLQQQIPTQARYRTSTPKESINISTSEKHNSSRGYASTSPVRSNIQVPDKNEKPKRHLAHLKFKKAATGERSPSMRAGGTCPPPPPPPIQPFQPMKSSIYVRDQLDSNLSSREDQVIDWFKAFATRDPDRAAGFLSRMTTTLQYALKKKQDKDLESGESATSDLNSSDDGSILTPDSAQPIEREKDDIEKDCEMRQIEEEEQLPLKVYVRKRPMFSHELAHDFDVVDASGFLEENSVLVFDTRMKADMRGMTMTPNVFVADRVFSENDSNEEVFKVSMIRLVEHMIQGNFASAFMFGQTGSGKTYTMSSLLLQSGSHIFRAFENTPGKSLEVSIFELYGTKCRDLLDADMGVESSGDGGDSPSKPKPESSLKVLEDGDGSLQFQGLSKIRCENLDEFIQLIERAAHHRKTSVTGVHDQSSRSHAFTKISISSDQKDDQGELLLVDLAGTERNKDSFKHDSQTQKEGAEINKSLMALKNCFQAQALGNSFVPFRASMLTRILKRALVDKDAKTSVIATISPSSGDTEHTLSTLKNVSVMLSENTTSMGHRKLKTERVNSTESIAADKAYQKAREANPKGWTADQVDSWWLKHAPSHVPSPHVSGALLAKWPESRFIRHCLDADTVEDSTSTPKGRKSPMRSKPKFKANDVGCVLYAAFREELGGIRKQQMRKIAAKRSAQ